MARKASLFACTGIRLYFCLGHPDRCSLITSIESDSVADFSNNELRSIFQKASELNEKDREKYVNDACGENAQLRDGVQRLLNAHDLYTQVATKQEPVTRTAITGQIGRFRILQRIGEGGFGEVWMAEQLEPIKRRVAIKVIKPGMDSKQVVARFEAERQALALMEHPNIARVYDGGETKEGRPYFVMELVKGLPITEYCQRKKLDLPARLSLFQQVCAGVQHAHQRGIIHRDIKPSNILVGEIDGMPIPKVIDFGIAKALERPLTDKTLFTEFRQFIGTPEYMSPEQAELSMIDVDTRSDVYALGVLLYELLAEKPPFDPKSLRSAGFDEMRRIIREEEPPLPSVALTGTGKEANVPDPNLNQRGRMVRGELDWIVQRAMAKERDRRYASAKDLEEDIERFSAGDAVEAGPPGRAYRVSRFVRRNRTPVLFGVSSFVALILVVVGMAIMLARFSAKNADLERAQSEKAAALSSAEDARKATEDALQSVSEQRDELASQSAANTVAMAASEFFTNQQGSAQTLDPPVAAPVDDYSNWLTKMLHAALPIEESIADVTEGMARPGWVIEVSADGSRGVVLEVDDTNVLVKLVAITDDKKASTVVANLFTGLRAYESASSYQSAFKAFSQFTHYTLPLAQFSTDGSRVFISPVADLLNISAMQDRTRAVDPKLIQTLLDPSTWSISVFNSKQGDLVSRMNVPYNSEALQKKVSFQDMAMRKLPSLAMAADAEGSRLAILFEDTLALFNVDTSEELWNYELAAGASQDKRILAISPSGAVICVGDRKKGFMHLFSGVKLQNVGEVIMQKLMHPSSGAKVQTATLKSSQPIDTLAFLDDARLLVITEDNKLDLYLPRFLARSWVQVIQAMDLNQESNDSFALGETFLEMMDIDTNLFPPEGKNIDITPRTDRSASRKILLPASRTQVVIQNGRWLEVVDLGLDMVMARTFTGRSAPKVMTPPSRASDGAILLWRQNAISSITLGSPVALGVTGDRGWAPSAVVSNRIENNDVMLNRDKLFTANGTFETGMRISEKKESDQEGDSAARQLPTEYSEQINCVSPDGRYVVLSPLRGARVLDTSTGTSANLESCRTKGGFQPISSRTFRAHSWANLANDPLLVSVGIMPKDGGSENVICTWDPNDGTLLKRTAFDGILNPEDFADQGITSPDQSVFLPLDYAVSSDGQLVAISGLLMPQREEDTQAGKLTNDWRAMRDRIFNSPGTSLTATMVYDRMTGERQSLHLIPRRLVRSTCLLSRQHDRLSAVREQFLQ